MADDPKVLEARSAGEAPSPEHTSAAAEIRAAASVLIERIQFLRQAGITFEGARDLYEILGYDRSISFRQYRDRYARGGIAGRVVDALPNATWRGGFELVEDKDPEKDTVFETEWNKLSKRLKVPAVLRRADVLAGLSTYSVLLIGAPGDLAQELPKGKGQEDILYLSPFSGGGGPGISNNRTVTIDADATILEYEIDPKNERFGLPKFYQLKRMDISSPIFQRPVHWTRIVHLAEGLLDDNIFGLPSLERVWNLLDDLDKITGGGAEAFWLRANQGMHLNVDKDMTLGTGELDHLRAQAEEYQHSIRRQMRTRGVDIEMLGSDVAMIGDPADSVLTQIAGAKSIPKRILTGSEMGELASSQDRDNWKDQVNGRQTGYCGPYIIEPLVDRLIKFGYLPTPKEYEVRWSQMQVLTDAEKSEGASKWASTNQTQGAMVFTTSEIREKWYGLAPLTDEQVTEEMELREKAKPEPAVNPLTGLTPDQEVAKAALDAETARKAEGKTEEEKAAAEERLKAAQEYKFSSTQVELPAMLANALITYGNVMSDSTLFTPNPEWASGSRESNPHITVKYGLHTTSPRDVREALKGIEGPLHATLGEVEVFDNGEADVVVVRVESSDLVKLNALLATELEVTDTHPTYRPHATIAYCKRGEGARYAGDLRFAGQDFSFNELTFSSSDGKKVSIPFKTKAEELSLEETALVEKLLRASQEGRALEFEPQPDGTVSVVVN